MKVLATSGSRGLSLTEIAARSDLPHPSVHRILRQLMAERLVTHDAESRRYRLGPLAFELGIASSTMYDLRNVCESFMSELAVETEDTIYLVVRGGIDAVCMHRLEGAFPVRTLTLEVGSRRPLGVGAGGLAILAAMEDASRAEIIEHVAPKLRAFGNLTRQALVEACAQTREQGAAIVENKVTLGVSAIGMPFRDSMGHPIGALSVAALTQRMTSTRLRRIGLQLSKATAGVERQMKLHWPGAKAPTARRPLDPR